MARQQQVPAGQGKHEYAKGGLAALLLVCRAPAPGTRTKAARDNAFAVDARNDIAVTGQQRFGRTHFGADRQLAFGDPVAAVFLEFRFGVVLLGATGAEGTFVHLAARPKVARLRILRRAEGAGVEAVTATNAEVL